MLSGFSYSGQTQSNINYDILNYMASQEAPPDQSNESEVKRHFKAYFIREVFLNNVFKSNHLFYGEKTSHGYELANQLMINQFSNYLSDSNFIDLSQVSFDEK